MVASRKVATDGSTSHSRGTYFGARKPGKASKGAQPPPAAAAADAPAPTFKLGPTGDDTPASNGRIDGGEFQRFFLQLRLEEIERTKQLDAAAIRSRDQYIFKLTREHMRTKPKQTGR